MDYKFEENKKNIKPRQPVINKKNEKSPERLHPKPKIPAKTPLPEPSSKNRRTQLLPGLAAGKENLQSILHLGINFSHKGSVPAG